MKRLLLLYLFLVTSLAFAQTKKEILLDENGNTISAEAFKSKLASPSIYFYTVSENDDTRTIRLARKEVTGKLEAGQRDRILKTLESLTGKTVAPDETIIINFFFVEKTGNKRLMIDNYTTDKAYTRFLKRNSNIRQFELTAKDYAYNKNGVIEDTTGTLQELFPYESGANYIIIRPDGSFLKRYAEYRQDDIPGNVKRKW